MCVYISYIYTYIYICVYINSIQTNVVLNVTICHLSGTKEPQFSLGWREDT